jgi:hypothetical protein
LEPSSRRPGCNGNKKDKTAAQVKINQSKRLKLFRISAAKKPSWVHGRTLAPLFFKQKKKSKNCQDPVKEKAGDCPAKSLHLSPAAYYVWSQQKETNFLLVTCICASWGYQRISQHSFKH